MRCSIRRCVPALRRSLGVALRTQHNLSPKAGPRMDMVTRICLNRRQIDGDGDIRALQFRSDLLQNQWSVDGRNHLFVLNDQGNVERVVNLRMGNGAELVGSVCAAHPPLDGSSPQVQVATEFSFPYLLPSCFWHLFFVMQQFVHAFVVEILKAGNGLRGISQQQPRIFLELVSIDTCIWHKLVSLPRKVTFARSTMWVAAQVHIRSVQSSHRVDNGYEHLASGTWKARHPKPLVLNICVGLVTSRRIRDRRALAAVIEQLCLDIFDGRWRWR
mmetsp:Transcript_27816/g.77936  ORF Transcript_27816/g.77936 Transcript_27816/m.77936 type:complete len:273 (+) Transcript_27816:360-1178(+)